MNKRFSDLLSFIPGANVEIQDTQSDNGLETTTSADSQLLLGLDPCPSNDLDPDEKRSTVSVNPNCLVQSDLAEVLPRNAIPSGWFIASQIDNHRGDGPCETSFDPKSEVQTSHDWANVTLDLGSPQIAGRDRQEFVRKTTLCDNRRELQNKQFQSTPPSASPIILKKCATSLEIGKKSPVLHRRSKSNLHHLSTGISDLEVSPNIDESPKIFSTKLLAKPRSRSINVPIDPLVTSPIVGIDKTFVGDISSTPRTSHRSGLYESNSQSSCDIVYSVNSDLTERASPELINSQLLLDVDDFSYAENLAARGLMKNQSQGSPAMLLHQARESSKVSQTKTLGSGLNDSFNDIVNFHQNQNDYGKFSEQFNDCKKNLAITEHAEDQCSLKSGPLDGGSSPHLSHSDSSSPSISTPVSKLKDSRQYFLNCFNLALDENLGGGNDKELYNAHISQDSTMSERELSAGEASNCVESVLGSDHSSTSELGLSQIIESGVVLDSQEEAGQEIDEDTFGEDADFSCLLEGADGNEMHENGSIKEEFRRPLFAARHENLQANSEESQRSGSKRKSLVPGGLASRLNNSIRRLNADWMLWLHQQCPLGQLGNDVATQHATTANNRTEVFNGTVTDIHVDRPFIKLVMKESEPSEKKVLLLLKCQNYDSRDSIYPSFNSKVTVYEPCSAVSVDCNDQSLCLFICPKFIKWN